MGHMALFGILDKKAEIFFVHRQDKGMQQLMIHIHAKEPADILNTLLSIMQQRVTC
jgi:hypothetical protein